MSKKSFIDSVEVKSPCSEDWNQMHGTDRVRFCSHCSKHVNNLSEMTRKQATRLVRSSNGNLCIRYIADPRTKRPMFAEQLLQITRHAPGVAAGLMTASIALSTQVYGQGEIEPARNGSVVEISSATRADSSKEKPDSVPSRFAGTILDPNGAVIVGAQLRLVSVNAAKTVSAVSDAKGQFALADLLPGTYHVEVEANGFATTSREVTVSGSKDTNLEISMEVGGPAIMVDVVLDPSELINTVAGGIGFVEYGTPLTRAVANDDLEEVRDMLVKGANPNEKDENYDTITPLFVAVENGNIEMVEMLINFGANVNARNGSKQTPLMRLDDDATPELVDLLIRFGAKVDLADREGNTALILAAGGADAAVVKALIDAGADIHIANKQGQTALMEAAYYDDLESVRSLINAGSNVNAKNKEGESAWDLTSNEEVENLLLSHGARPKRVKERTPDEEGLPEPPPQSAN